MRSEPPHFIISGRCPSHKNTYQPIAIKAFKFKTMQAIGKYLMSYRGPQGKTCIGTLSLALGLCIAKVQKWLDWEKHAREAVQAQLRGRRYESWVHVKILYYPPSYKRVDFDAIIVGVLDVLQDKVKHVKIGAKKRVKKMLYSGIYADDAQVNCTDGTRIMMPDEANPRLEIWVWPYTPGPGEIRK